LSFHFDRFSSSCLIDSKFFIAKLKKDVQLIEIKYFFSKAFDPFNKNYVDDLELICSIGSYFVKSNKIIIKQVALILELYCLFLLANNKQHNNKS
jgi:hypothetical protein